MTYDLNPTVTSTPTPRSRGSFLTSPFVRAAASFIGWFGYILSFALLVLCFSGIEAVGGVCASGNTAYVIQTQCPQPATVFLPWVIFTMLIFAAVGIIGAQGFGVPLEAWAWPILFWTLGLGFFAGSGVEGILLGLMFEVMGLIPLILELRGGVKRVFIGSKNLAGTQLIERDGASKGLTMRATPNQPGAVTPGLSAWVLGPLLFWIGSLGGIYLALVLYSAVLHS
jgi:hypothetical protein